MHASAAIMGSAHPPERQNGARFLDFGRAVSRILSASTCVEGEDHLSGQPVPGTRLSPWSGPLRGPLFGLAPDGVFRASTLARGAVGSYPTFSPLPGVLADSGRFEFLWHCPSGRLAASPPVCIPIASDRVTRHRARWCSDFPPPACAGSGPPPFQNQRTSVKLGSGPPFDKLGLLRWLGAQSLNGAE